MTRGHWILVLVMLTLGGYLAYDFKSEEQLNAKKESESKLFSFPAEQVNELRIQRDGVVLRLQRSVDGWNIVEPFEDRADDFFVDEFVERLTEEKSLGAAKEGDNINWSVFGLDQPTGKISLKTQGGQEQTLEVSARKNFEQNSFARVTGEKRALVVNSAWLSHLERTGKDFRDKRILRAKIADVRGLQITLGSENFSLERTDNSWSIVNRPEWPLDQNRVREVLSMINETRAHDILGLKSESGRAWQAARARVSVKIQARLGEDRVWSFEAGRTPEGKEVALVSDPSVVMDFEAGTLAKFEGLKLDGLRDKKKPFEGDLSKAVRLIWETPIKKTIFFKKETSWAQEKEGELAPDSARVEEFLKQLAQARAVRYATTAEAPLFRAVNTLEVEDGEGRDLLKVQWTDRTFGNGSEITHLAKSQLIPDIFHLSDETLKMWSPAGLMPAQNPKKEANPEGSP